MKIEEKRTATHVAKQALGSYYGKAKSIIVSESGDVHADTDVAETIKEIEATGTEKDPAVYFIVKGEEAENKE